MGPGHIEGLKQGLKYAFAAAALFEGFEMLRAASLHPQPIPEWGIGTVFGVGVGILSYVSDIPGYVARRSTEEVAKIVRESDGKVTFLHSDWSPEP